MDSQEANELALELEQHLPARMENGGDNGHHDQLPSPPPATPPPTKKRIKFNGPFFAELCGMQQADICKQSVETGQRSMWNRWRDFKSQQSNSTTTDPWVPNHGLQLYSKRTNIKDPNDYDRQTVDEFFGFLAQQKVGKSVMPKAKGFLNTNLKCEHCCRLREAGHHSQLVQVEVGKSLTVKNSVTAVNTRAASEAFDRCEDIQADLDQLISAEQIRTMTLFALNPKPGGKVSKLDPLCGFVLPVTATV